MNIWLHDGDRYIELDVHSLTPGRTYDAAIFTVKCSGGIALARVTDLYQRRAPVTIIDETAGFTSLMTYMISEMSFNGGASSPMILTFVLTQIRLRPAAVRSTPHPAA